MIPVFLWRLIAIDWSLRRAANAFFILTLSSTIVEILFCFAFSLLILFLSPISISDSIFVEAASVMHKRILFSVLVYG